MPISAIDGCNESHWADVFSILSSAIEDAGFAPNLVSNADDVGIIQKRIIQNLYDNPVVVCDVSGKNANVMFELGMRLAFDKPTIIIKDDKTSYSFDTAPIEHLEYPRDLRFSRIVEFKSKLKEKIKSTYEKSSSDNGYSPFLKSFGEFTVAKINEKEIPAQDFILDEIREIKSILRKLSIPANTFAKRSPQPTITVNLGKEITEQEAIEKISFVTSRPGIESATMTRRHDGFYANFSVVPESGITKADIMLNLNMMPRSFSSENDS